MPRIVRHVIIAIIALAFFASEGFAQYRPRTTSAKPHRSANAGTAEARSSRATKRKDPVPARLGRTASRRTTHPVTEALERGLPKPQLLRLPNGYSIAFSDEQLGKGNGETIVFLSGLTRGMRFWNDHASYYTQRGYRVVRVDPINVGSTLEANGPMPRPALERDAEAVASVLKHLGLTEGLHLVGHSRGAAVALLAETILPEGTVHKVFLSNPYVQWLTEHYVEESAQQIAAASGNVAAWNPFYRFNPFVRAGTDALIQGASASMARRGVELASPSHETIAKEGLRSRGSHERLRGLELEREVSAVKEILDGMKGSSVLPIAPRVRARVEILTASSDQTLVPNKVVKELLRALRSAAHTTIGGGHYTPQESAPAFRAWLDRGLGRSD